jgi:hypothetical protein
VVLAKFQQIPDLPQCIDTFVCTFQVKPRQARKRVAKEKAHCLVDAGIDIHAACRDGALLLEIALLHVSLQSFGLVCASLHGDADRHPSPIGMADLLKLSCTNLKKTLRHLVSSGKCTFGENGRTKKYFFQAYFWKNLQAFQLKNNAICTLLMRTGINFVESRKFANRNCFIR